MLRIRLSARNPVADAQIASRLCGATIEPLNQLLGGSEACRDYDAIAFSDRQLPEEAEIDQLLHAGKHVLVAGEPPWPLERFNALKHTAQQTGMQLAVLNPERYLPSRQLIRQQIPAKLGETALVRIHRWEPVDTSKLGSMPHGIPSALIRDIDVALWLIDRPPACLFALEQQLAEFPQASHRFLQIHLGFPEGMALVDYTNRLPPGDEYCSLSVIGVSGAAQADDHQNMQLVYRGGLPQGLRTDERARQQAALVQDFVDAVSAGRDVSESATSWRRVFAIVEAIQQSLATRQAVSLEGA